MPVNVFAGRKAATKSLTKQRSQRGDQAAGSFFRSLLGEVVFCRQEQAGWLMGIRVERALSRVNDLDDAMRRSR